MIADLRALVGDLVRDVVDRLGETACDRAIGLAVTQYGKDRRRLSVSDLAVLEAPAPRHLALPEGWDAQASTALTIEHPIGHVPPCLVPRHVWSLLDTPAGRVIGLPGSFSAGEICRLAWTRPHQLTDELDTIPAADREAVAQYASAVLLDQVAAMTSGDQSSMIHADAVDHKDSAPNYAERARTARRRYHDLLGIDPKRIQAASVIVSPPIPSTTGQDWLLHRRRRR